MTRLSSPKVALASAFGAAADAYHSAADVQREVASRLARRITEAPLPARPRVLEIGCGTGFLAQALLPDLAGAAWTLSDLSQAMVRRARVNLPGRDTRFVVMDGERPACREASFDLICASLVFQWFEDLSGAITRLIGLLRPKGVLAFSTLTRESFPEWRNAHREIGAHPSTREYPTLPEIATMIPGTMRVTTESEAVARSYRDAHAFLTHWKQIGTHLPDASRPPLTPGAMRTLLRRFAGGITVTYQVAYVIIVKD